MKQFDTKEEFISHMTKEFISEDRVEIAGKKYLVSDRVKSIDGSHKFPDGELIYTGPGGIKGNAYSFTTREIKIKELAS